MRKTKRKLDIAVTLATRGLRKATNARVAARQKVLDAKETLRAATNAFGAAFTLADNKLVGDKKAVEKSAAVKKAAAKKAAADARKAADAATKAVALAKEAKATAEARAASAKGNLKAMQAKTAARIDYAEKTRNDKKAASELNQKVRTAQYLSLIHI